MKKYWTVQSVSTTVMVQLDMTLQTAERVILSKDVSVTVPPCNLPAGPFLQGVYA